MFFDRLRKPPSLPARTSPSLEDDLDRNKEDLATSGVGQVQFVVSWAQELRRRPFDRPMYTALRSTPTILVYLSSDAMSSPRLLQQLIEEGRQWTFRVMAFTRGPVPVLRCLLTVPDNPRDPFLLESPLDIREGDVQAFCTAAFENEAIDIIAAHEAMTADDYAAISFKAAGLAAAMRSEVGKAIQAFRSAAPNADIDASVRLMESTYASAFEGHEDAQTVPLVFAGQATHPWIQATYQG